MLEKPPSAPISPPRLRQSALMILRWLGLRAGVRRGCERSQEFPAAPVSLPWAGAPSSGLGTAVTDGQAGGSIYDQAIPSKGDTSNERLCRRERLAV